METSSRLVTRILLFLLGFFALAISYLFQYTDFLFVITKVRFAEEAHFIVNRIVRIVLNDLGMTAIIYAIFYETNVLKVALLIQLVDLVILLPVYLLLKLPAEGVTELSTPFLSQFHRLIVNPTLLILLIPAMYYQRSISQSTNSLPKTK